MPKNSKELYKDKCKDCKSDLEQMTANDGSLISKCVGCSKNYEKDFDKNLAKRFQNAYKMSDGNIKKFCLILRKGVYPYNIHTKYINSLQRFIETSLVVKKVSQQSCITDADYKHVKKAWKNFEIHGRKLRRISRRPRRVS